MKKWTELTLEEQRKMKMLWTIGAVVVVFALIYAAYRFL